MNLKSIGANVNFKKNKTNIFFLRRMNSEITINYDVIFFIIKKLEHKCLKDILFQVMITNVGKTIVSSILVNKLEAQYFKPIQCGKNEFSETDSDVVKKFCPNAEIIPETYFFKRSCKSNIASKKEKRKICLKKYLR